MNVENIGILSEVQYPGLSFLVGHDGPRPYLQVEAEVLCAESGKLEKQRSRKWFLSPHMTRSEIVQTAFKAVLTWEEHEVREKFKYRGQAIFGPHFDVDALHELASAKKVDVRGERTNAPDDIL